MKDTHKLHNKLNLLTFILNYNTSIFFLSSLSKNGTISENKTIMETQGYVIVSRGRSPLTGRVCLSKISEKNPLKVPRSCVCRCGLNFFSPLRGTNSITCTYIKSCHILFWLSTLKCAPKSPAVALLSSNTLRGVNIIF